MKVVKKTAASAVCNVTGRMLFISDTKLMLNYGYNFEE